MQDRKQILEAMKKGLLSPEEGLDLLENLGLNEEPEMVEKTESLAQESKMRVQSSDDTLDSGPESATTFEAPMDKVSQESDSVSRLINEWETATVSKDKEDPVLRKIDELDQTFQRKQEQLKQLQEEYRELNLEAELGIISAGNAVIHQQMEGELRELEAEITTLKEQQTVDEQDFFTSQASHATHFFDALEDFDEHSYQPREPLSSSENDFGSRLQRLVHQAVRKVSNTMTEDLDWGGTFYGTAKTHLKHQFYFEKIGAKSLDFKVARGQLYIKTWDDEEKLDVTIDAEIALLGQMAGDPLESFLERSRIEVDDQQMLFHVPNKRVEVQLTCYLPQRYYDEVTVRLLKGELVIENVQAEKLLIHSTSGAIVLKDLAAALLEIQGTDNQIELQAGEISAGFVETVNGTIIARAALEQADFSLVNGDIKVTAGNATLKSIKAHSINGDVKVALPPTIGLAGVAKTSQGMINYRLTDCETTQEWVNGTQKRLHLRRIAPETAEIELSSTAGNIFLKDYDK